MSETTFTSYTPSQAALYAIGRSGSYPLPLYTHILSSLSPLPSTSILLDVGCGTGKATRDLSPAFSRAIGVDPSPSMIGEAAKLGGKTLTGDKVEYFVRGAEELEGLFDGELDGKVDLIVSAMAAHWFDMERFWEGASKLLKPNGSVTLWTCSSLYCHPSTPNAQKVQEILFKFERETLAPYELPGNRISRDMYLNLPPPSSTLPFGPVDRKEWDKDGIPSDPSGDFLAGSEEGLEEKRVWKRWNSRWRLLVWLRGGEKMSRIRGKRIASKSW